MFYYETTLACDLVCKHCRASAQEEADPEELSTGQAKRLLEEIATFDRKPMVRFHRRRSAKTGRSLRADSTCDRARTANRRHAFGGRRWPRATRSNASTRPGSGRLGISLDGADAANARRLPWIRGKLCPDDGDAPRGEGTRLRRAGEHDRHAAERRPESDAVAESLVEYGIMMWGRLSSSFPSAAGWRRSGSPREEYEEVFARLYHTTAQTKPYAVKTTRSPPLPPLRPCSKGADPLAGPGGATGEKTPRPPRSLRRRRWQGESCSSTTKAKSSPPAFSPCAAAAFPQSSIVDTYRNHPTFIALRDPDHLKGNCGRCEYRQICGGSRSRAYAVTGDPLETEPDCVYVPGTGSKPN